MKTVAIHQPNLLPWQGFFAKAQAADTLVILTGVQFSKGGYQNRVKINDRWVTVAVQQSLRPIKDIKIADPASVDALGQKLYTLYRDAWGIGRIHQLIDIVEQSATKKHLIDLTIPLIRHMAVWLAPHCNIVVDSEMRSGSPGSQLSKIVNDHGDTYLAGPDTPQYLKRDELYVPKVCIQQVRPSTPGDSATTLLANAADPLSHIRDICAWEEWK